MTTKKKVTIFAQAPTRIDLAGGTVDLWPIYLFLRDPITINLGISLYAEATLEITPASPSTAGVQLKSKDQGKELKLTWDEVMGDYSPPPALELHYKLLKYFLERRLKAGLEDLDFNLDLTTFARSPAGAGLGGSSTLSIALVGALATWANSQGSYPPFDPETHGEDFIEIVRDVETTVIQVPAGLQDYYGAMYGSLQALRWGPGTHERKKLSDDIMSELEDRLLLFYSGQSRNSGINNWVLFKNFIDRVGSTRFQFQGISGATQKLERALLDRNWIQVGEAIAEEWSIRKTLASGITTPEIDRAFEATRSLCPSVAGKVCGAGGGGCFFIYLPIADPKERSELKKQIQQIFSTQGIQPLPFEAARKGLQIQVTRAGD